MLLSTLIDGLRGIKSNKAMGMQARLQSYLEKDIRQLARMRKRIILSSAVLKNFQEPVQVVGIALALYSLTSFWTASVEELLVLILLFYRSMWAATGKFADILAQIVSAIPPFWFVTDIISSADFQREDLESGDSARLSSGIEFTAVSFSYGKKKVLDHIDLTIRAGEFITIVGTSGGGKTTLIDMLLRFNEPDSGSVTLDGRDIKDISKSSLRQMVVGMCPRKRCYFMIMLETTSLLEMTLFLMSK